MTESKLKTALLREIKKGSEGSEKKGQSKPIAPHLQTGRFGEDIAADHLRLKGFKILDRNVRVGHCEIDIIAREGDELVFAEVRTRSQSKMMNADESVGPRKMGKLIRAGEMWTQNHNYNGFWRIDLVAVTISDAKEPEIEHFRDITEPIL